ncbi:hypothetical protein O181_069979 [Austropuccinia psidii MF-1]|uniref:Uncharacterized protein n=1 Tax=Austropuccinia psidii MF-1 TaxID=1389203 RepID=A0A9Q3EZW8_9BASI|nr:hypothetical protein [Austropuccinia psidii MF-1]
MVVDCLTKALDTNKQRKFVMLMGMLETKNSSANIDIKVEQSLEDINLESRGVVGNVISKCQEEKEMTLENSISIKERELYRAIGKNIRRDSRHYAHEKQNRWIARTILAEKSNKTETTSIPILNSTKYSEWYLRISFLLQSKDCLEIFKKAITQDATPPTVNWWTISSFAAITMITSQINCCVFVEVINSKTSEKANLLWSKINKQYAPKRAMNKGWVWMNWETENYSSKLHHYIEETKKYLLELHSVIVKMPSKFHSYIILGKLAGDPNLSQIVELLTLNEEVIKKPDQILSFLQEYTNNCQTNNSFLSTSAHASALVSSTSNEP